MNKYYPGELVYICIQSWIKIIQDNNWVSPPKKGKGKLSLFCGNVEQVITIYATNYVDYLKSAIKNVDNSLGIDKTALNNYGDGHRPYSYRFSP